MGIAPCEALGSSKGGSLVLMWPVSRGDLVGLHKAQLALFLIV